MPNKGPGDEGTTVGQIKTPMCPENVGRKNTPGTHDYSKALGGSSMSGGKGGTILGPGAKGTGGGTTKAGSNAPGRY